MLSSQLHPGRVVWQNAISHSLILLILLHFIHPAQVIAQQLQTISIPVASPQIVYTPFVCNASTVLADPQQCSGAWQLSNDSTSISTTGPESENIIPQMFLEFQASMLTLTAIPSSNASVDLSISSNGFRDVSAIFNSSSGFVTIVNLPENGTTLLTITYIPSSDPTLLFGLQSIIVSIPDDASTSSIFPTPSLPPFVSLPTFIPTSSSSATPTSTAVGIVVSNQTMVAQAAGITIGLGLGLTTLSVLVFYYLKRRKQRLADTNFEEAKSEWTRDG